MGIIFLLVLISALIAIVFLVAFVFSVKSGQFDDTDTPARRIILDDFDTKDKPKSKS
ncbi:MAG: cbb3-type cytochrome oxidase assembly protein CcoS [Chitinophagales bacterium]